MNKLVTKTGEYSLNRILSSNFPFQVYDAINTSGRRVIVKKMFEPEATIVGFLEIYHMFHGLDLKTSAWYGHKKANVTQINGEELLIQQYNYLIKSGLDYNLTGCMLEFDLNNKPVLIYDYVEGENLYKTKIISKSDCFLKMIPALMRAVSNYPHGDLSFSNLILHEDENKFSIIDPAIRSNKTFFTNTEYYPLVPPLFYPTQNGFLSYADQLAIGLMLYKLLTGINPLKEFSESPFWSKDSGFGNPIGGLVSNDIYSVISIFPESWEGSFAFNEYTNAIRSQLRIESYTKQELKNDFFQMTGINTYQIDFPSAFFDIKPPNKLHYGISDALSNFCMSLIFTYEPIDCYIDKIQQLIVQNQL